MQDRQIHVIFGGSLPVGYAWGLQMVPLSSQSPQSRQEGALRPGCYSSNSASICRPLSPCLPPAHPPSFSFSSPPLRPLSQPPVSSLLLGALHADGGFGGQKPCFAGGVKKSGQRNSYWRQAPPNHTQPPTTRHNPREPSRRLLSPDLLLASLESASSLQTPIPDHRWTDEQTDGCRTAQSAYPGGTWTLTHLQAHMHALLPSEHTLICTHILSDRP